MCYKGNFLSTWHSVHAVDIQSTQGSSRSGSPKIHPPPFPARMHSTPTGLCSAAPQSGVSSSELSGKVLSLLRGMVNPGLQVPTQERKLLLYNIPARDPCWGFCGNKGMLKASWQHNRTEWNCVVSTPQCGELVCSEHLEQLGNHVASTFHVKKALCTQRQWTSSPEGDPTQAKLCPSLGTSCCTWSLWVLGWKRINKVEFEMKSLWFRSSWGLKVW